jgi:hypothetical protein
LGAGAGAGAGGDWYWYWYWSAATGTATGTGTASGIAAVSRRGCDATKSLILGGAPIMALDPVHPVHPIHRVDPRPAVVQGPVGLHAADLWPAVAATPAATETPFPPASLARPHSTTRYNARQVVALMPPPCCRRAAANLPDSRVHDYLHVLSLLPYGPTSAYADTPHPWPSSTCVLDVSQSPLALRSPLQRETAQSHGALPTMAPTPSRRLRNLPPRRRPRQCHAHMTCTHALAVLRSLHPVHPTVPSST